MRAKLLRGLLDGGDWRHASGRGSSTRRGIRLHTARVGLIHAVGGQQPLDLLRRGWRHRCLVRRRVVCRDRHPGRARDRCRLDGSRRGRLTDRTMRSVRVAERLLQGGGAALAEPLVVVRQPRAVRISRVVLALRGDEPLHPSDAAEVRDRAETVLVHVGPARAGGNGAVDVRQMQPECGLLGVGIVQEVLVRLYVRKAGNVERAAPLVRVQVLALRWRVKAKVRVGQSRRAELELAAVALRIDGGRVHTSLGATKLRLKVAARRGRPTGWRGTATLRPRASRRDRNRIGILRQRQLRRRRLGVHVRQSVDRADADWQHHRPGQRVRRPLRQPRRQPPQRAAIRQVLLGRVGRVASQPGASVVLLDRRVVKQ